MLEKIKNTQKMEKDMFNTLQDAVKVTKQKVKDRNHSTIYSPDGLLKNRTGKFI